MAPSNHIGLFVMSRSLVPTLKRRANLVAQREKIDAEIRAIDAELIPRITQMAVAIEGPRIPSRKTIATRIPAFNPVQFINGERAKPGRISKLKPIVIEILQGAGVPLKTQQILEELAARGINVTGKKPLNNLAAHLSHFANDFATTPEGWRLRQEEITH